MNHNSLFYLLHERIWMNNFNVVSNQLQYHWKNVENSCVCDSPFDICGHKRCFRFAIMYSKEVVVAKGLFHGSLCVPSYYWVWWKKRREQKKICQMMQCGTTACCRGILKCPWDYQTSCAYTVYLGNNRFGGWYSVTPQPVHKTHIQTKGLYSPPSPW